MNITPPLQCRITNSPVQCEYNDKTLVGENHTLEWRGEVLKRYNSDHNDMWKLCAPSESYPPKNKWLWVDVDAIDVLGRTPGPHTLKEFIEDGGNPFV